MNSAEFKTIGESLGLTAQWLADYFDVNLRTIQYWQSGERANPPEEVCLELLDLDRRIDKAAEKAFQIVLDMKVEKGLPEEVVMYRFKEEEKLWKHHPEMQNLPVTCHAALLARLRKKLIERKFNAVIDYFA